MRSQKRKKLYAVLAILTLTMTGTLSGCQKENTKTAEEEGLPVLRIGADIVEPFFYIDENGDYAGIDAELAKEACRRAGYEPAFKEVTWNERNRYLSDGFIDCIWTAFIMDGRENDYLWTDPYLESSLAVIVQEGAPSTSLEKFRGPGGIAVRAGSKMEEVLLSGEVSFASGIPRIYSCGTAAMAMTAFAKGYTDALGGHEAVIRKLMNDNPGQYRYLEDNIMTTHLGVAFKKGKKNTYRDEINAALMEMKEDGTVERIAEKYDFYPEGDADEK